MFSATINLIRMKPYYEHAGVTIYNGDCLACLKELPSESVNCCVTSPPYWGLRDYGLPPSVWGGDADHEHGWESIVRHRSAGGPQVPQTKWNSNEAVALGQRDSVSESCECGAWLGCLGLEPSFESYVEHLGLVFTEVKRILRYDGTLWLNLGDSYSTVGGSNGNPNRQINTGQRSQVDNGAVPDRTRKGVVGLKPKDLVGIPWRVAFALQKDGWWLRSDIIWHKPGPMPESVTDRPTRSHEYIFLLAKSDRYYYDHEAIKEPSVAGHGSGNGYKRESRISYLDKDGPRGSDAPYTPSARDNFKRTTKETEVPGQSMKQHREERANTFNTGFRNKRDVWTVNTATFTEAHFATFPPDLILPCILAGSHVQGTVLDPFLGSATTALVAKQNGRKCIGIDLNPEYIEMAVKRLSQEVMDFG